MENILLVSEKMGFLVSSLKSQLEERGCLVMQVECDPNELGKIKDEIQLIMIYAEELRMDGLVYSRIK